MLEADLQVTTDLYPTSFLLVSMSVVTVEGALECIVSANLHGKTQQDRSNIVNSSAQQFISSKV